MTTEAESKPLAQYLTEHGVDPAQAAVLGAQGDIYAGRAGTIEERATMRHALAETQPPPPKAAPAPTASPAEAAAALEAHTNAQLSAQLARDFSPPANAWEYRFPAPVGDVTDEDMARDSGLKGAFHAEGWPAWLGNGIPQALSEGERTFSGMTPEQVQARIASTEADLKRMWGKEFDRNLATVDSYLEQMARRNPDLGIDGAVRLENGQDVPLLGLLDAMWVDRLYTFANYRAGRR